MRCRGGLGDAMHESTMIPILAAALISTDLLTKLAIFGAVACGAWWLLGDCWPRASRAPNAGSMISASPTRRRTDGSRLTKRSDGMTRLLERASPDVVEAAAAQDRRGSRQAAG